MLTRRTFSIGALAATAASTVGFNQANALSAAAARYFDGFVDDNAFRYRKTNFDAIQPEWHRSVVQYYSEEPIGTIVVDTRNHYLYYIYENQTALRYGVGVGREGFKWFGRARVDRRAVWPRWTPPPEMHARQPGLPQFVEGGDPINPLGPRALYLYDKGRDTGYRLHGTTEPWSIGKDVSSGCIRMFPEDIVDLYQRAPNGTAVLVLEHIASPS
ncbi:MAG: L,D-transpeptidase [Pseudomonadota bacterium]